MFTKDDSYRAELNHYIQRLDDAFESIRKNREVGEYEPKPGRELHHIGVEVKSSVIASKNARANPWLSAIDSGDSGSQHELADLRARLVNVRNMANAASQARYLATQTHEVILANLIMQVLNETNMSNESFSEDSFFFDVLASSRELKLEEALEGFEFFDNNPYKEKAEKYLARIKKRRNY